MSTPKSVTDVIAALRAERGPLAARLDAIDLAIDNLSRVFGINGTPQALPLEAKPERRKKPRLKLSGGGKNDAAQRRDLLLAIIGRSDVGVTISQLRKATPKMDGKDRSNAVQQLKAAGQIKRAGNSWVKAA